MDRGFFMIGNNPLFTDFKTHEQEKNFQHPSCQRFGPIDDRILVKGFAGALKDDSRKERFSPAFFSG